MAYVPRTEQIVSTLRPGELERLDRQADRLDLSRAETIRTYVMSGVKADEQAAIGQVPAP